MSDYRFIQVVFLFAMGGLKPQLHDVLQLANKRAARINRIGITCLVFMVQI